MNKRMKDERIDEIGEYLFSLSVGLDCADSLLEEELWNALKAERDRVNFLWEKIKSFAAQCKKHKNNIEELEAQLKVKCDHGELFREIKEQDDFIKKQNRQIKHREKIWKSRVSELQRKYDALACAVQRARDMNELRTLLKQEARDE